METKRYCSICGSVMNATPGVKNNWVKYRLPRFDEITGEEIDSSGTKYSCPKDTFWSTHDLYFIKN